MVKRILFGLEVDIDIDENVFPTKEEIQDIENAAPGCQHGWFISTYEHTKLAYHYWIPSSQQQQQQQQLKGVIIFLHGVHSHGEKGIVIKGRKLSTSLLAHTFLENGYAFYAPDQYGHGMSEGNRTWIPSWEVNMRDTIKFVNLVSKKHPKDIPLFVSGESYGGCLSLHVARYFQDHPKDGPSNFDSILLAAPAIIGDLPPRIVVLILRYMLAPFWPKWRPFFMPNTLPPERIWRDEAVRKRRTDKRYMEMKLEAGGTPFLLGTGVNLLAATEAVREHVIPGLNIPFCIVHGTEDAGVPISGSELLMEKSTTPIDQKEFHRMEGAYHDVFGDPLAEESIEHWISFMKKRTNNFSNL